MGSIISAIVNGALTAAFNFISSVMEKRGLIQQGREQQHAADLEATVKESTDAAQIRTEVQIEPDAAVDADLERLRHPAIPASGR